MAVQGGAPQAACGGRRRERGAPRGEERAVSRSRGGTSDAAARGSGRRPAAARYGDIAAQGGRPAAQGGGGGAGPGGRRVAQGSAPVAAPEGRAQRVDEGERPLRRTAKASQGRVGTLEAELSKLRATAAVLSGTLYGRRSEKQETPRCGRRRGQRSGAPGHGRTPRPGIEERVEVHAPPAEARVCAACGKSYAANGADESSLLEIEVRAHRRVIRRGRWRRRCGCASSPLQVSAPAVPRLFPSTPYGTSVWSRFLFEHYACLRPLHRVAAWLGDQGLPVAPGTLADSAPRFVPLFEPLAEAIRAHQNASALRHADETTWRVQALRVEGRSARAWLWTSVGNNAVYFHIDPSRSAEAAATLFGELRSGTVIVCDRYSAYKKLRGCSAAW